MLMFVIFQQPLINWKQQIKEYLEENNNFINICYEAIDRHGESPDKERMALRYVEKNWPSQEGAVKEVTYEELIRDSCRFSHVLIKMGIQKGDVLFSLLPRRPELYTVALGTSRAGVVF
jgi:acetyl-CoA synthetase